MSFSKEFSIGNRMQINRIINHINENPYSYYYKICSNAPQLNHVDILGIIRYKFPQVNMNNYKCHKLIS